MKRTISAHPMVALALLCSILHFGCKASEPDSTVIGGYTFSSDFDGERRVLRIESSDERVTECMRAPLPGSTTPTWKETELDATLHARLIGMIFDAARLPSYEADTEQTERAQILTCDRNPNGTEFCYFQRLVVTGVRSPWSFGLHPEIELTEDGQELVDEFLAAHEVCWESGD